MYGFYGRILNVDMTHQTWSVEAPDESILKTYLGGKGLASYLLYHMNPPGIDPLSPENCLIFNTGPAGGTSVWGGCRYGVFTKSPQTGRYSESYAGGRVPEAIDATGFDAIVIQGCAKQPTVLVIHPDEVQFYPAGDIWGMETYQTEDTVKERFAVGGGKFKKTGAVVIGPAAENLIRFAVIENDYWRSAGRTGVGTVMGSKKLKAIVFQGDRKRKPYDEKQIKIFSKEIAKSGKDNPGVQAYKSMGTPMMVKIMNQAGAFPSQYWSRGTCEHWEKISAEALHTQCRVQPKACLKCMMACGRMTTVLQGRHAGLQIEGPEYETIYVFGGLCMIDSIEEIAFLNDICDRLGMDTISAGNLCAFAIEASRLGKIEEKLSYNDADAIADLLCKIARREGIGDILAEGIIYAAKKWDLTDRAVQVKGMEPAGYDPRVLKGMGLAYATSDRGACHLRTTFYKPELSGMIDPTQIEGKAKLLIDFEDRATLFDTLVLCRFYRDIYQWDALGQIIHGLTGIDPDKENINGIANRISDLVRCFNLREGMKPEEDRLPKSLHKAIKETGQVITEAELDRMLKDFYRLRGWDEQGRPLNSGGK